MLHSTVFRISQKSYVNVVSDDCDNQFSKFHTHQNVFRAITQLKPRLFRLSDLLDPVFNFSVHLLK